MLRIVLRVHDHAYGGDSSVVERRIRDRKVADFRFDSQTGNASLCPWKRYFTLVSHRDEAVYLLWTSRTKDLQTEPKKVSLVHTNEWQNEQSDVMVFSVITRISTRVFCSPYISRVFRLLVYQPQCVVCFCYISLFQAQNFAKKLLRSFSGRVNRESATKTLYHGSIPSRVKPKITKSRIHSFLCLLFSVKGTV